MTELAPGLNILHGDCMELMRGLPDGAFDLAIVDPPYGTEGAISTGGGSHTKSSVKFHQRYKAGNSWDIRPGKEYFNELLRVTKNQIVCGGNYFADMLPTSRGWAFWDKLQEYAACSNELIYTSFNCKIKTFKRFQGMDNGFMNPEGKFHPTQKPVALYRWLLTNYAKSGDTILDTHLGSGSSAIAAWEMGYTFTGIEIDADYYAAAVERIRKKLTQPYLPGIMLKETIMQPALIPVAL